MFESGNYTGNNAKKPGRTKQMGIFLATVILIAAFFWGGCADEQEETVEETIVATVNGEPVYSTEFKRVFEQQVDSPVVLGESLGDHGEEQKMEVLENHFIIPILLQQAADKAGVVISEEEIEERYREYTVAFGGEERLMAQLESLNISREELIEDIARELLIQQYLKYYIENYLNENPRDRINENLALPDEEVRAYHQQLLEHYAELQNLIASDDPGIPREQLEQYMAELNEQYGPVLEEEDFEVIAAQLEDEMRRDVIAQHRKNKEQGLIARHIDELKEKADIQIHIF